MLHITCSKMFVQALSNALYESLLGVYDDNFYKYLFLFIIALIGTPLL